jgi:hypothetical protein
MAWTVQIGGKEDSTELHRPTYLLTHLHGDEPHAIRIQWHLVFEPVGIPLEAFTCIQELISIYIDVVDGEFWFYYSSREF